MWCSETIEEQLLLRPYSGRPFWLGKELHPLASAGYRHFHQSLTWPRQLNRKSLAPNLILAP